MATALILDDDLGFVLWLSQALAPGEIQAIPSLKVTEAKRLLRELGLNVDVLIVNPMVPGAGAYAKTLLSQQRKLRMMAVVERPEDQAAVPFIVHAVRTKPLILDDLAMSEWRQAIERLLSGASEPQGGRAIA